MRKMAAQPERRMEEVPGKESSTHRHRKAGKKKEDKPPFFKRHPTLAAIGTGAASLAVVAGLACTPAARAQAPTTPSTPTALQSPDVRVAGAEAREPQRGAQTAPREERVAQVSPSGTRGYESTAVGSDSAARATTDRVYEANPQGEQPEILSGEDVRRDYGYTFQNTGATVRTLPLSGTLIMGDWEIQADPSIVPDSTDVVIKNSALGYEAARMSIPSNSKIILLPFPETEYARGPMLIISHGGSGGAASIYFFNKVSNCVTTHAFFHGNRVGIPEVGTEIYENKPYFYVASPGSLTQDGDMLPGTRFYMYVLITTQKDGNGPGAATGYFERSSD